MNDGGALPPVAGASSATVRVDRDGAIARVMIDRPPVNALGAAERAAMVEILRALDADATIAGIVIAGAAKSFAAGSDIVEFDRPPVAPVLRDVVAAIEAMRVPTLAAIHGPAFGGGLELAMGCRFRIADRDARFALPEVKLGLIPGAGGTARLPRLVDWRLALTMIATGEPISAEEALEAGLVDAIVDGDLVDAASAWLRRRLSEGNLPPKVSDRQTNFAGAEASTFDLAAHELLQRGRATKAEGAAIDALRSALSLDFEAACLKARELFEGLRNGDESRALRHLFFAERQASRPSADTRSTPRPIRTVGVVGGGTMGSGIAIAFANAGKPVVLLERDAAALAAAVARIGESYERSRRRGSLSSAEADLRQRRISGVIEYAGLSNCDLVVEAVFEDEPLKRVVFRELDRAAKPGAVLATNTSYLDVDAMASVTGRSHDVIGLHFFAPANVMKLVEVARGRHTSPDTVASVVALARQLGKLPVVVASSPGFVGNRMLRARNAQIEALLVEGAFPADIDAAFTDFGWRMGPCATADLSGLDISWRARAARGETMPIADFLCARGHFGQKRGRGYYIYEEGAAPRPNPEVESTAAAIAARRGIVRRAVSAAEIIERTHLPLVNEGMRVLDDGVAARMSDIDVIWVHGYGFPRVKGGPMHWATSTGLNEIVFRLRHWHGLTGDRIFEPARRFFADDAERGERGARP